MVATDPYRVIYLLNVFFKGFIILLFNLSFSWKIDQSKAGIFSLSRSNLEEEKNGDINNIPVVLTG